jgi:rhodanese-related sulfurtransferase
MKKPTQMLFLIALLTAAGCQGNSESTTTAPSLTEIPPPAATKPVAAEPADGIKRISVREAKAAVDRGAAVAIDVRNEDSYRLEHIAGAVHLPYAQFNERAAALPKDKLIVAYCSCPAEESSSGAAGRLISLGFTNVAALTGGTDAWKSAGYPMESGS